MKIAFRLLLELPIAFMIFMMFRLRWVSNNRIRLLDEDSAHSEEIIKRGKWPKDCHDWHPRYNRLPSFNKMLLEFWVWDINKFLR